MCSITSTVYLEPALIIRMEGLCHNFTSNLIHSLLHATNKLSDQTSWAVPAQLATSSIAFLNSLVGSAITYASGMTPWHLYLLFSLFAVFGWMLVVVHSTFSSPSSSKLEILSLKQSFAELMNMREGGSRLDVLDVFRVVAICWVVANHLGSEGRLDVLDRLPSAQTFKSAVHNHPVFGALLGNSALGVEIFLVLSGLLAARSWSRKAESPFNKHCVSFLVKRWLRLAPIVAVFVFLATGPLMESVLPKFHSTMVSTCGARGILSHLTMTGNWQSTPTCLGYLWYLGLDMQLYIAAPFLLHFLYWRPRMALAIFAFLISFSAMLRAVYCQLYDVCNSSDVDIPFISYPGQDPESLKKIYAGLWEMYSRPHTKCGPFLLGLLMGHLTTHASFRHVNITPAQSRRLFHSGLAFAVGVIYAILPEYWYPEQGNTLYNTLYTALFRTAFAAAVCVMILALYMRTERTQIDWYWSVAAKLTFNAYLLHMPVVYLFNHVQAFQHANSVYELLLAMPFAVALSFALALVFYCFVESPLGRISSRVLQHFKM